MEREEMLLSLADQVHIIASVIYRRVPEYAHGQVTREDLIGEGWLGACRAVDRFRPGTFLLKTFAEPHIRGSMQDYLRRIDFLTREGRRNHTAAVRRAGKLGERAPLPARLCSIELASKVHGRADQALSDVEHSMDVQALFSRAHLTPNQDRIVRRVYLGEERPVDVARDLGFTGGYVSAACGVAIAKLHAAA